MRFNSYLSPSGGISKILLLFLVVIVVAFLVGIFIALAEEEIGVRSEVIIVAAFATVIGAVVLRSSTRKTPTAIAILAVLVSIWIGLQLWSASLDLDSSFLAVSLWGKNIFGLVVLVVWGVFILLGAVSLYDGRENLLPFFLGIAFAAAVLSSMIIRETLNLPLLIMYTGWIIFAYIISPSFLQKKMDWLVTIRIAFWTIFAMCIYYVLQGIAEGQYYWRHTNEFSFGFKSVQVYGRALATAIICGLILATSSKNNRNKSIYLLLSLFLGFLLLLAQSRSNWLFVIGIIGALGIHHRNKLTKGATFAAILIMSWLLITGAAYVDQGTANNFSSGRLAIFIQALRDYANSPDKLLLGSDFQITYEGVQPNRGSFAEESRYVRVHIENGYLDLLFSHGLISLILFALPIAIILAQQYGVLGKLHSDQRTLVVISIGTIYGLAVSSLFTPQVPSFGNPLAIFLPLIWLPVQIHATRQANPNNSS